MDKEKPQLNEELLASRKAMPVIDDEVRRVENSMNLVREIFHVAVTSIGAFTFCGTIAIGLLSLVLGFKDSQSIFAWFGAIGFLAFLGSYIIWRCLEKTSMTCSAKISLTLFCGLIVGLGFIGQGLSWFAIYGQTSSIWIPLLAHSVAGLSGAGFVMLMQSSKKKRKGLIEMKQEDVNGLIPPTSPS